MVKGMRSKLLLKPKSVVYVLVFIAIAAGLYYLFRGSFRTKEGNTPRAAPAPKAAPKSGAKAKAAPALAPGCKLMIDAVSDDQNNGGPIRKVLVCSPSGKK
jgi:hypothetical protein